MRVLLVKTSSLGDIIHTLPAVSDAVEAVPGLRLDWLVEEAYQDVPRWHPGVCGVHSIALRRWRRRPWRGDYRAEWSCRLEELKAMDYDLLVDAQGLLKSAWLCRQIGVDSAGYDRASARESFASLAYRHRFAIDTELHAMERSRQLLAAALAYPQPGSPPRSGLQRRDLEYRGTQARSVLFLHGSARADKLWPEAHWVELARALNNLGLEVLLPWGSESEHGRAQAIAGAAPACTVLPRNDLSAMAERLCEARAAVAVDSGLGHLAAALDVPTLSLYGRSSAARVGTRGRYQRQLESAGRPGGGGAQLMSSIGVEEVLGQFEALLRESAVEASCV